MYFVGGSVGLQISKWSHQTPIWIGNIPLRQEEKSAYLDLTVGIRNSVYTNLDDGHSFFGHIFPVLANLVKKMRN